MFAVWAYGFERQTKKENTDIKTEDAVVVKEEIKTNTSEENTTEVEEIKVVTKLTMPSRRLKIKISNELLFELEKLQINFKLN